jgi:PAS domain S-box-containing protein
MSFGGVNVISLCHHWDVYTPGETMTNSVTDNSTEVDGVSSQAVENDIRVLQSLQLQRSMPVLLEGNLAAAAMVAFCDWDGFIGSYAYVAVIGLFILLWPMAKSYSRLRNAPPPKSVSKSRLHRIRVHSLLMGLAWCGCLILLLPCVESTTGLAVILMMFFLGYGSVALNPSLPSAAGAYFGPIFLASFAGSIINETMPLHFAILLHVIGAVAMIRTARQNWEDVQSSVRMSLTRLQAKTLLQRKETEGIELENERREVEARDMRTLAVERERAENEATAKTRILEQTLGNMGQGLTMFDGSWNLVTYNTRYQEHFHLSDDVFEGAPTFDDIVGATMRQDYSEEWRSRRHVVRDPSRMTDVWRSVFSRPDGRHLDLLSNPIPSGGFVVTSTDITDLKVAEEAMRVSEERYRGFVDGSVLGIVIDRDGKPLFANRAYAELFNFADPADVLALDTLDALYLPEDLEMIVGHRHNRRRGDPAPERYEFRTLDNNDQIKWLEGRFRPIVWNGEQAIQSTIIDITERKAAEDVLLRGKEDAEALVQAKSDFVAVISHEVRTPMNGVLGMAQLMTDMNLGAEPSECLDAIRSSGEALVRIVDDLLDMSKLEAGKLELELAPLHLPDVLAEVIKLMAPRAQEKRLDLFRSCATEVPPVLIGDALRLRQILLNLIGNAIKFTETGSITADIRLTGTPTGQAQISVVIADTGKGIAPEAFEHLFDEYSQGSAGIANRYGGTGLGLAICRRLAAMMNGAISVESVVDKGSVFTFSAMLEVDDRTSYADLREAHAKQAAPIDLRAGTGKRVLQVEDNVINRQLVNKLLTRAGYAVVNVGDGAAALDAVKRFEFHTVIMDRHMPRMNGLDATREIRGLPGARGAIPILGLTAGATRDELDDCLQAGMNVVMTKPLDSAELLACVARFTSTATGNEQQASVHPVLVVDDHQINRLVAIKQLESLGLSAQEAHSASRAWELVIANRYHAILLDVSMPGMDGLEFTRRLRAREESTATTRTTPALRVIAMTGHADGEARRRCIDAGMDDLITKPVDRQALANALRALD